MKVPDSGMPEEAYWNTLFDIGGIVSWLPLHTHGENVVEVGCGWGTFSVPICRKLSSSLVSFDIEPSMLDWSSRNLSEAGLENFDGRHRDVVDDGTGLESDSRSLVLLFNILHFAQRKILLTEALRILEPGGILAAIHWRSDIPTPRGPALDVRPTAADIEIDALEIGFASVRNKRILESYHWGLQLVKR